MLELKNIVKDYVTPSLVTHALKGISINFRKSEFVAILGPSGCGKTTLLNIVGGLDRYTSGDLIIEGKSTKEYRDRDWDTYRNHSIGFVFQSYNLISHQTILSNVELALTISGVKKKERQERAKALLEKVGLKEAIYKYPNQLSGGQMQRVAIARSLINNPEILLADEPTGALDSETSLQIMDLLKEIASDRLVIMVTHNPDLANRYATRIVTLSDGEITSDSNPCSSEELSKEKTDEKQIIFKGKKKYSSMSFWTAFSLSFKNLWSKKARTILMTFAGSIGIIGIALVLAMSDGFNTYIDTVQVNTLSQYPITINRTEMSMESMLVGALGSAGSQEKEEFTTSDNLGQSNVFSSFFSGFSASQVVNDLASFKTYLESEDFSTHYSEYVNAIQYVYDLDFAVYQALNAEDIANGAISEQLYPIDYSFLDSEVSELLGTMFAGGMSSMMSSYQVYNELIDNQDLLLSQYDVIAGHYPMNANEMVLVVDSYNSIPDYVLYALGLKDPHELVQIINGEEVAPWEGTFDDILNLSFKLPVGASFYHEIPLINTWVDVRLDNSLILNQEQLIQDSVDDAIEVKISGIMRVKEDNKTGGALNPGVYYLSDLSQKLIDKTLEADVVIEQMANPNNCVIYMNQEFPVTFPNGSTTIELTYDLTLTYLGVCDEANPSAIYLYPNSFDDKEQIILMIDAYNNTVSEAQVLHYTDTVGILMDGISTIIDAVTIVLICFVSISLVVSSIMIGVITYVSVIERTKEIGILRSLGASKNDISNVFNAETLIIGLTSGAVGVIISLILIIPINLIVGSLSGMYNLAFLAWYWALLLIAISVILTLISGLIPSRIAARKDPVNALRSGD